MDTERFPSFEFSANSPRRVVPSPRRHFSMSHCALICWNSLRRWRS